MFYALFYSYTSRKYKLCKPVQVCCSMSEYYALYKFVPVDLFVSRCFYCAKNVYDFYSSVNNSVASLYSYLVEILSWSKHITSVCNKARRLLGLLYRRFYQQSEPETLLKLYMSLVRPYLEYASQVWSPHINKDITLLENVQKFAFKLCTKQWDLVYEQL